MVSGMQLMIIKDMQEVTLHSWPHLAQINCNDLK